MQPVHVWVIDDDAEDIGFLKNAFSRQAEEVSFTECTTGQQAIDYLAATDTADLPHVIFLDLYMPGKNGYQTLTEIKAQPAWVHIPVIIISSSMLAKDIERCTAAGCVRFLTKPMSLQEYDEAAADTLRSVSATQH